MDDDTHSPLANFGRYLLLRTALTVPLLIGVTLLCFILLAGFTAPDEAPLWLRYGRFLLRVLSLDFGSSTVSGEPVGAILARSLPLTLAVTLPGFFLGHAAGLLLAMICARRPGGVWDRAIGLIAGIGLSLSLVVVIVLLQALIVRGGWTALPLRGWDASSPWQLLLHGLAPMLALGLSSLCYNLRFYRAALVEQLDQPYVRTARAFGATEWQLLWQQVLPNAAPAIITRLLFSAPGLIVSGGLLVEICFGIPGLGLASYRAVLAGDAPLLTACVTLTALTFTLLLGMSDALSKLADPRLELR